MTRKEAELTEEFMKDPEDEEFLERLNSILAPYQEDDYKDLREIYPTLQIIGAPRSGTTLLSQLISTHLDVGYINNLIAAFWKAPVYGIRLSKKLLTKKLVTDYASSCGRTSGIDEPHEFGYFWFSNLEYEDMHQGSVSDSQIDWNRLATILKNMSAAFSKPVVFKNFLIAWHMEKVLEFLPKTCFVRISRDPVSNALSMLDLRMQHWRTYEKWASMKPVEYDWLRTRHFTEQVVGQVYYLETSMTDQIGRISPKNILEVTYEQLCDEPCEVLENVASLLNKHGAHVDFISQPPGHFEKTVESNDDDIVARIEDGVKKYYG